MIALPYWLEYLGHAADCEASVSRAVEDAALFKNWKYNIETAQNVLISMLLSYFYSFFVVKYMIDRTIFPNHFQYTIYIIFSNAF